MLVQGHKNWQAGMIALFVSNWEKITTDAWVLQAVQGYRLELEREPRQQCTPITQVGVPSSSIISEEVEALREKGAIKPVNRAGDAFYSRIFVVPKKGGKFRPVVNLRPLNRFMIYSHFKMEGIQVVRDVLQRQDWLTRIDLKDAYLAVPICQEHRKYLRFIWANQAYEFQCLPFGLSTAPRAFTKILRQ